MGILFANIPAFAFPTPGLLLAARAGAARTPADIAVWLTNFVFVEGKMRGLFSFLFGASMLLVIDRARASGRSAARVHFSRMAVLFLFGMAHMYLIWWGDILAHYALVGAIAFLFARMQREPADGGRAHHAGARCHLGRRRDVCADRKRGAQHAGRRGDLE